MDEKIREIALSADEATEYSRMCDDDNACLELEGNVIASHKAILEKLKTPMELNMDFQDSVCFASIGKLTSRAEADRAKTGTYIRESEFEIRFSPFGRLAGVDLSPDLADPSKYNLDHFCAILKDHGFIPIMKTALDEPYDGKYDGGKEWARWAKRTGYTWWDRSFRNWD